MIQIATPLPANAAGHCATSHRPQRVESRGTPSSLRGVASHRASLWHVECALCGLATIPHPSRAVAHARWIDPDDAARIPLSGITQARVHALTAITHAA